MRRRHNVVLAVVAAVAGSALVAGPASAAPKAQQTKAATGAPLRIGVLCSCSGPQSTPLVKTYDEAWAKWVNAHGGINGHPVKLYIIDEGTDPVKSATGARKLINQYKVHAIAGYFSTQAASWAEEAQKAGIPVIGSPGVNVAEFANPMFFPTGIASAQSAYASAVAAKVYDVRRIGVLYCTEAPVCGQVPGLVDNFAKMVGGGVEVVASAKISGSQPSYAPQCLAMKNGNAVALIAASASPVALRVVKECVQQGWKPFQLSFAAGIGHNDPPKIGNIRIALTTQQVGIEDTTKSGSKKLHQIIDKYAPSMPKSSNYNASIGVANASLEMFAKAATKAKLTPTSKPSVLVKGLYGLKDETLGGLIAPITYTPGKPTFVRCWFFNVYNGKSWRNNTKPQCMSPETAGAIQAALGGGR